jgi:hypothetical protein
MVRPLQRNWLADLDHPAAVDAGNSETRMRAADVSGYDAPHDDSVLIGEAEAEAAEGPR